MSDAVHFSLYHLFVLTFFDQSNNVHYHYRSKYLPLLSESSQSVPRLHNFPIVKKSDVINLFSSEVIIIRQIPFCYVNQPLNFFIDYLKVSRFLFVPNCYSSIDRFAAISYNFTKIMNYFYSKDIICLKSIISDNFDLDNHFFELNSIKSDVQFPSSFSSFRALDDFFLSYRLTMKNNKKLGRKFEVFPAKFDDGLSLYRYMSFMFIKDLSIINTLSSIQFSSIVLFNTPFLKFTIKILYFFKFSLDVKIEDKIDYQYFDNSLRLNFDDVYMLNDFDSLLVTNIISPLKNECTNAIYVVSEIISQLISSYVCLTVFTVPPLVVFDGFRTMINLCNKYDFDFFQMFETGYIDPILEFLNSYPP